MRGCTNSRIHSSERKISAGLLSSADPNPSCASVGETYECVAFLDYVNAGRITRAAALSSNHICPWNTCSEAAPRATTSMEWNSKSVLQHFPRINRCLLAPRLSRSGGLRGAHWQVTLTLRCSVVRNGNRDIAPPGVDRSAADLWALAQCLTVRYPGAIVPPLDYAGLRNESVTQVNTFLKRLLAHPELRHSEYLLAFVLYPQAPKTIYSAQLAGADAAFGASAARMAGSIEPVDEVDAVIRWSKEKDLLLDLARRKAIKAQQSIAQAAMDATALLTAGGVLLPEAPSGDCGISPLLDSIDDEQRYVACLREAAYNVKEVHDRLHAARSTLVTAQKSFQHREGAFSKALSSTQHDVNRAKSRVDLLQNTLDRALMRFSGDAKAFVRDFPERWSTMIDTLVDAQIGTATSLANCLGAARREIVKAPVYEDDDDRKLSERILNAPDRVAPPPAPDLNWMAPEHATTVVAADATAANASFSSMPDWYKSPDAGRPQPPPPPPPEGRRDPW